MVALERARGWLLDVFAHHHAEGLRTGRAVERKMHGLKLDDLPYPGSQVIVMNTDADIKPDAPAVKSGPGWLQTAVLGAAIVGGAGLTAWLVARPSASGQIVAPATPPASQQAPLAEFWKIDEQQQPDGSWKEVGRVKLRQYPDGHMEQQAADGSWSEYKP